MIVAFPQSDQTDSHELATSALQLAALGSETRLSLFRLLVVAGSKGMNTGLISEKLGIAGSTLNHHLATLETAELIERLKEGRNVRCRVLGRSMHDLVAYLTRNCCCDVHCDIHGTQSHG